MPDTNVTMCVNTQKAENSVLTFRIIKMSHKRRTKKKKSITLKKTHAHNYWKECHLYLWGRIIYNLSSTYYGHLCGTAKPIGRNSD